MRLLFAKVPAIVYATIVIGFALIGANYLLGYVDWLKGAEPSAKIGLFSSVLTVVGLFYLVIQIQTERRNNLIATEYINQPNFEFQAFSGGLLKDHSCPELCSDPNDVVCTNNCNDEHWFNLIQIGNLPASDLKISLLHQKESEVISLDSRIQKVETLIKDDIYQYKVPPFTFSHEFLDKRNNGEFNVLLSYRSLYSNIKYKRWYIIEYAPTGSEIRAGIWGESIKFFSVVLKKTRDENSIKVKDVLVGQVIYLLVKLGLRKSFTCEDWIIHF